MSGIQSSEGEAGHAGATGQHCSKEFGNEGSVSSAGSSQKKEEGSGPTRRSMESCQLNDMDFDVDENKEELSFIDPNSCVSGNAKQGFKYYDIVSVMVEDSGKLHTRNLCRDFFQSEGRRTEGAGCNRKAFGTFQSLRKD